MSNGRENTNRQDYAAQFHVRDLDSQVKFYTESIGLQLQWKTERAAGLGACSTNILLLSKSNDTHSSQALTIKLPSRRELAKVIGRLLTISYRYEAIDHGHRQCAHVKDPEGNDIEICIEMAGNDQYPSAQPLDLESLLNELDPDDRLCDKMPDKTTLKNRIPKQ
jgi:catechol 2,3-dioxygenase